MVIRGSKKATLLARISEACLAMPEATRELSAEHATFRVRRKVFAYFLNNHHGDGIVSVCVKSELGENEERVRSQPDRYYLPAHIGSRGWLGVYLNRGPIDWAEVANVIALSYRVSAPRSLVERMPWSAAKATA